MRMDSVIYLITYTSVQNAVLDSVMTPVKRETLARKNSVRQSEHYQAATVGLKPDLTFTIWTLEYNDESALEYEGATYNIIRTFVKDDGKVTELICSGLVIPNEVS